MNQPRVALIKVQITIKSKAFNREHSHSRCEMPDSKFAIALGPGGGPKYSEGDGVGQFPPLRVPISFAPIHWQVTTSIIVTVSLRLRVTVTGRLPPACSECHRDDGPPARRRAPRPDRALSP
jgi:hypothetical protein